jgi:hypothetical protein
MDNMVFVVNWASLLASLITVIGGYLIIVAIWRWYSRPKLALGFLPDKDEMQTRKLTKTMFGKTDPIREFRFDSKALVKPLHFSQITKGSIDDDDIHTRYIMADDQGNLELFGIIQNFGLRGAEQYKLVITFSDPGILVTDVRTETLKLDCLFSSNLDAFMNKDLLNKAATQDIIRRSTDFGIPGAYVSMDGSLASGAFEGIFVAVRIPPRIKEFWTFTRVEYSQEIRKADIFAQPVKVLWKKD